MALCFCFGRLADRATRCPLQANIVDKHTPELKVLQDDVLGSVHELALGRQIGRGAFGIVIRGRMAFDSGQQARFSASLFIQLVPATVLLPRACRQQEPAPTPSAPSRLCTRGARMWPRMWPRGRAVSPSTHAQHSTVTVGRRRCSARARAVARRRDGLCDARRGHQAAHGAYQGSGGTAQPAPPSRKPARPPPRSALSAR